jgi:hypothetical protein
MSGETGRFGFTAKAPAHRPPCCRPPPWCHAPTRGAQRAWTRQCSAFCPDEGRQPAGPRVPMGGLIPKKSIQKAHFLILVLTERFEVRILFAEPNCFPPNANALLVDTIYLALLRKISPITACISRRYCSPFPVVESRRGWLQIFLGRRRSPEFSVSPESAARG